MGPDAIMVEQVGEAVELLDFITKIRETDADTPIFLTGDFNSVPSATAIRFLSTFMTDLYDVYGTSFGFSGFTGVISKLFKFLPQFYMRLDYVFAYLPTRSHIQVLSVEVPYTEASDHLPVVAKFGVSEH
eukprot:TRINITY_DN10608_c0_g1_i2.p1 TRINITY_DN10608_c0_g1~~TRINITY_DN10608_c0_g1_i2.p1  ORF type:complete len:130 (-),score=27.55 TRINITY_DN10608_c0_g1_i2:139-528(-)